jgi:hypothetical protein
MSGTSGSGLFSKMMARLAHLLPGHGLPGEVLDVRNDVAATLKFLKATTIEEYLAPPAALPVAIMAVTATSLTAVSYTRLTGVTSATISPPRNTTVTTAGTTPTHAPASFTIIGLDAQGNKLSETISGTNGGAATYSGVKCFAQITGVTAPAGTGVDATFSIGTGIVIGLSQTPKLRAGLALPLIAREIVDGAVVTTGALTLPATNPPFGAYTPATAPTTAGPAVVDGTADITAAGLYGVGGTLAGGGTGLTLILNVNGGGALTLTFDGTGATNDASEAAMLAAIQAEWPALTAVQGGSGGNKLVLTTTTSDFEFASIVVGSGTANTALGLTPGTFHGGGHLYAIDYEYDATLQKEVPYSA